MVIIIPRITSDDMRSILHRLMERDRYYYAHELDSLLRIEVQNIESSTNKRARQCRDWIQRVAQLLCNDPLISVRNESTPWYWWGGNTNKYCLSIDENDIAYYTMR